MKTRLPNTGQTTKHMRAALFFCCIAIASSCALTDLSKRIMHDYYAPARLVHETLHIHCMADRATVHAVFHLEAVPKHRINPAAEIYFPGPGWPLRIKSLRGLQQGAMQGFTAIHNGRKLPLLYEKGRYSFLVDFTPGPGVTEKHTLEFSYTALYQKRAEGYFLGYVLKTGSLWRGSIGRLELSITHSPQLQVEVLDPYTASLILGNVLPKWDIGILVRHQ